MATTLTDVTVVLGPTQNVSSQVATTSSSTLFQVPVTTTFQMTFQVPTTVIGSVTANLPVGSADLPASVILIGPLTTAFSPPPNLKCLSAIYCSDAACVLTLGPPTSSCFPSRWVASGSTVVGYSPAICPSGYTTAANFQTTLDATPSGLPKVINGGMCCPVGYYARIPKSGLDQNVYRPLACTSSIPRTIHSIEATTIMRESEIATPIIGASVVDAAGIGAFWQCTDTAILAQLPTGVVQEKCSNVAMFTNAASNNTSHSGETGFSSTANSGGLGPSAKAGIIVGVLGFVAICLGVGFIWFRRKRKLSHEEGPVEPAVEPAVEPHTTELDAQKNAKYETASNGVYELGHQDEMYPYELAGSVYPTAELRTATSPLTSNPVELSR